ncbi:hypothetical protein SEA_AMETHYST_61 [Streptomyces phage Amethyst]|uniref:Uncharacterized protein n=1 Tax=Streptomyces phage Amethyst TaxID=2041205 RepID=A0A291LGY9_9CAUD|nr:hypothetical protein KGG83_gp61 [Streptomyces phage Amethyst]ATI18682.1 hypothetical protein SEA_AMETHYST_61 [Streptomyces phage Amethyst]
MLCKLTSIKELDELPDGSTIEIEDRRGTRLYKEAGHWRSPTKTATQNMIAYVNVRRWGVTVIERGPSK